MSTARTNKEDSRRERIAALFPQGYGNSPQPGNFAQPLIITSGKNVRREAASLPGCFQYSPDMAASAVKESSEYGLNIFALFAVPEWRDDSGQHARKAELVCQTASEIRSKTKEAHIMADVCVCQYTSHGHCAILDGGVISSEQTLEVLAGQALSMAKAGVDILMPSGMISGANSVIRSTLDQHGFDDVLIISQVKFASSLYNPFRKEAYATSDVNKSSYQIAVSDTSGAFAASLEQFAEGADMVLIKPAIWNSDIISLVNGENPGRVGAFCTSGELAMITGGVNSGNLNGPEVMHEMFCAIKRAGAELIISYQATQYLASL